jgi:tetratricopeptide (TPR) repeat protein
LAPVIGVVQVGQQGIADRYTYVPLTGVFLAVVWGGADLVTRQRIAPRLAGLLIATAIASYGACTWVQVGYWRDDVTLWAHALTVTGPNPQAYDGLGQALLARGQAAEALPYLSLAAECAPGVAGVRGNVGVCFFMLGRFEEGKRELSECLRLDPRNFLAHYNLGKRFLDEGKLDLAAEHLRRSLDIFPDNAKARAAYDELVRKQALSGRNAKSKGVATRE